MSSSVEKELQKVLSKYSDVVHNITHGESYILSGKFASGKSAILSHIVQKRRPGSVVHMAENETPLTYTKEKFDRLVNEVSEQPTLICSYHFRHLHRLLEIICFVLLTRCQVVVCTDLTRIQLEPLLDNLAFISSRIRFVEIERE